LRVFLGLDLSAAVPALILGLAMGWSHRMRALIDPFVAAIHPVPKIAILPIIMIIFGIGELSKVIVVSLGAFFPMLISTMAGVQQISPIYFEVAESCGAKRTQLFSRIVLPGSLPMVMSGIRLALNMAFLITIATELVVAKEGLGAMIWFAWQTLRIEELYLSLGVTAVLGIAFNAFLQWLARRLIPWQEERAV
jgi:ABC-type nitrate/sulfonate/bicarbonate transport system permease component